MRAEAMLEVRELESGYAEFRVRDVSFKVSRGGFAGIIGPNGSGKTTLLRTVTGAIKKRGGRVLLAGCDTEEMKLTEQARLAAVVSQSAEVSHILVEEFVLLGRIPHRGKMQFFESKRDMAVAEEAMRLSGTIGFREKYLDQLSGGERQLVNIARALAQEPQLLILDEPTTFLDISHQVGIMDLIKRLNRQNGLTVVTVLHDLNLAAEYCDHLILMKEGRVHKQGAPEEVLTYQTIEDVYNTTVVVVKSPVSSHPYIFVVTEEEMNKRR